MSWEFFTASGVQKTEYVEVSSGFQSGFITNFAGTSAPAGWLLCQGQEVSISSYPDLYKALGTTYGATTNGSGATGTTHFRVPDLRGRAVAGAGPGGTGDGSTGSGKISGTTIQPKGVGYWTGATDVTISGLESGAPSHTHSWNPNSHTHTASGTHSHTVYGSSTAYENSGGTRYTTSLTGSNLTTGARVTVGASTTIGSSTSGATMNEATPQNASSSHENRQPYIGLNFIIKQ